MIIKHYEGNELPEPRDINLGELVVQYSNTNGVNEAKLFSKNTDGKVLEIGKGVKSIYDLRDIDFTNLKDGSFIVKQGDKFICISQVGSISSLVDVEVTNPEDGDYLRYDSNFLAFINTKPSYNLFQLLDVDILDSTVDDTGLQDNQVLYYDHDSKKFKTRNRINTINELEDVKITNINSNEPKIQILTFDNELELWTNKPLKIENDLTPKLGGNLNSQGNYIKNNSYRLLRKVANVPILECRYEDGDYFVIEGVTTEVNNQCIIAPKFSNVKADTTAIMMLEIRQSTGIILIGGLVNSKYEDGKPILLSGNSKTDLVTITHQKYTLENVVNEVNYITLAALNLASLNQGGVSAERYDKSRYIGSQLFNKPEIYDTYMEYVELLLTFEDELSTNKDWKADKSYYNNISITSNQTQYTSNYYVFGLLDKASESNSYTEIINFTTTSNIVLDEDFTYEFFILYKDLDDFISNTTITHTYLNTFISPTSTTSNLYLKYIGNITTTNQDTELELKVGNSIFTYENAYVYFKYNLGKYIHIAVVREGLDIRLYIDGILQTPNNGVSPITISNITINRGSISQKGVINSVRLSKICRYKTNFTIPNLRFGLISGYGDVLSSQVFGYNDHYTFNYDDEDDLNNILAVGRFI